MLVRNLFITLVIIVSLIITIYFMVPSKNNYELTQVENIEAIKNLVINIDSQSSNTNNGGLINSPNNNQFIGEASLPTLPNIRFTSDFARWGNELHKGLDYAPKIPNTKGVPLYSVYDGQVESKGDLGATGNYIYIKFDNGYSAVYMHMASPSPLAEGTKVKKGQQVGIMGSTGQSTGVHLHLEMYPPGYSFSNKLFIANNHLFGVVSQNKSFGEVPAIPLDKLSHIDKKGNFKKIGEDFKYLSKYVDKGILKVPSERIIQNQLKLLDMPSEIN